MYKVKKALFLHETEGTREEYLIFDEGYKRYPLYINSFIRNHSINSVKTGKQYAYILTDYMNYLEGFKGMTYRDATIREIDDYFYDVSTSNNSIENREMIRNSKIIRINHYLKSPDRIKQIESVLIGLYIHLLKRGVKIAVEFRVEKETNKYSFMHGQVWSKNVYHLNNIENLRLKKKQNHIKFYSDNEIKSIFSSLKTERDKCIFSLTLEGMRIDEVLSLRYIDFEPKDGSIELYRSKGRETGHIERTIVLSNRSVRYLSDYLNSERDEVIRKLRKKGVKKFPTALFVNLRNDDKYGEPVSYRNWIKLLKTHAEKVGFDPAEIRTHIGRSTRAMQLIHQHMDDSSITMDFIQNYMGWRSAESMKPYINKQDKVVAQKLAEKLQRAYSEGSENGEHK